MVHEGISLVELLSLLLVRRCCATLILLLTVFSGRAKLLCGELLQNVLAVAAPEKAKEASLQSFTPPPFKAWETGKKISKRTDIKTILLLGAGPIVIGQVNP